MDRWYFMCTNLSAAARNRRMVAENKNIIGYLFAEALVKSWPHNKLLPEYLLGTLPIVGKNEQRELHGFHEVE